MHWSPDEPVMGVVASAAPEPEAFLVDEDWMMARQPTKTQVRKARLAAGLSVQQAADMIGKSHRTWVAYEAGTFKISASAWEQFHTDLQLLEAEGELTRPDGDWVTRKDAMRYLGGRSTFYLHSLAEAGSVETKAVHETRKLYRKADLIAIKEQLEATAQASSKKVSGHYSRQEVVKKFNGAASRVVNLTRRGLLTRIEDDSGAVFFDRQTVDTLAQRAKDEEGMLSAAMIAKDLGVSRQALHAFLQGTPVTDPTETLFQGKRYSPAKAKQIKTAYKKGKQ